MREMLMFEVDRSNQLNLDKKVMEDLGTDLAQQGEVAAVWIADEGWGIGGFHLQIAVATRGRTIERCLDDTFRLVEYCAQAHAVRIGLSAMAGRNIADAPAEILSELGLKTRLSTLSTVFRRLK
ncbi:hypothetical protein PTQ19_02015 [Microbacterium esteraromaticum]|uniref:hypothetical protein n=1 Tax=Microbacterium esteraromaticum TaxID=57043 RepID=UPI0023682808|nr:hypothetical protein [Microbacterium esteraromaticum]WDH79247.1 hypothetical protein PTQ19_02015 [Microbacterium esteraromaticum]